MDILLEGVLVDTVISNKSMAGKTTQAKGESKRKKLKISIPLKEVDKFLTHYPTTKIVVVIETHCLKNGCFVWTGKSPSSYEACSLKEVHSGCITSTLS